ncbi:Mitotic spindle checkpoint protein Bub1/Mad3 protein [Dioscorea alata]|uniref:Mitotic spindle checkpoint protein Bub1/Mad3 protein n=1 Tax=Dioscorea alata TaxID=55571 RepID=A0ACB7U901_DIOAL|nr:Mitotic spindle checkpoint protein Bub1/Mad3 protein [Dioscorea alata]
MATDLQKELLASLISEIKEYQGQDPLLPWLQGIRKMKESLPSLVLQEKLPRFLQKCVETFETDRRYRNDSRFLRIWIQLMDYVDDAKVVLRRMEKNQIGIKRASFYSAYALYYEKRKNFDEAEKMYHLGVQNLAEPVGELQKSYEQFIQRLELYRKRKAKGAMTIRERPTTGKLRHVRKDVGNEGSKELVHKDSTNLPLNERNINGDLKGGLRMNSTEGCLKNISSCEGSTKSHKDVDMHLRKQASIRNDDTVVVKFVGSAIVGKSEAEDACHHGLVDPTVNMKEAMNAISSMFREPLEAEPKIKRRSHQSKPKVDQQTNAFEVFIDESLDEEENLLDCRPKGSNQKCRQTICSNTSKKQIKTELQKPFVGEFKILADDEEESEDGGNVGIEKHMKSACSANSHVGSKQITQKSIISDNLTNLEDVGMREDTIIQRFVGSTIVGESKVENACHHGLVDPTINLKEAINDINSMFGQPLNIMKTNKPKKHQKIFNQEPVPQGFCILGDDEMEGPTAQASSRFEHGKLLEQKPNSEAFHILADDDGIDQGTKARASSKTLRKFSESDLFEPTVFTREALADINEMFGKPLDF